MPLHVKSTKAFLAFSTDSFEESVWRKVCVGQEPPSINAQIDCGHLLPACRLNLGLPGLEIIHQQNRLMTEEAVGMLYYNDSIGGEHF